MLYYYDCSSVNINFIHLIHLLYLEYLNGTKLPSIGLEQSFGENNVTMTVSLDLERGCNRPGIIYGLLFTSDSSVVSEPTKGIISGYNQSTQLTVFYNSQYNLSVFSNLCGHELQSEVIHIFYGE